MALDLSFLDDAPNRSTALPGTEDAAADIGLPQHNIMTDDFTVVPNRDMLTEHAIKMAKGTTTLAFIFKHGVLVAVDSRSTMGAYIASQTVQKVIPITKHIIGTMAGGAADCAFWERDLGRLCRLYELRNKERISVAAASKLLANTVFNYKSYGLSIGAMMAGFDKTGANLFYVDSEGERLKGTHFSVGSGASYAYGVLDTGYRFDMTVEEACELGRRAIYHATHRDAGSGGLANVWLVTEEGWRKISADDVSDLYYHYQENPAGPAPSWGAATGGAAMEQ